MSILAAAMCDSYCFALAIVICCLSTLVSNALNRRFRNHVIWSLSIIRGTSLSFRMSKFVDRRYKLGFWDCCRAYHHITQRYTPTLMDVASFSAPKERKWVTCFCPISQCCPIHQCSSWDILLVSTNILLHTVVYSPFFLSTSRLELLLLKKGHCVKEAGYGWMLRINNWGF